jgi:DnaJ-like protein
MAESDPGPDGRPDRQPRPRQDGKAAAAARMAQQQTWVDLQVRQAMERGDFDNLPGAGKPIADLGDAHDPDWWLKKLVERENVALLPPSVALRKEDAELDATLDKLTTEAEVRRHLQDFNDRVIAARYRTPEGPPLVTMPRDLDATVAAWRERRTARLAARRAELRARAAAEAAAPAPKRRRWWRR